ncbi:MAG: cobalamin-dependent protein [Ignavibacteriales bacterium]
MEKNLYEIKVVSEKTGLSPLVIRAWENRYSAVKPQRTQSNRRLYSEEDIEKLKLLKEATKSGFSIGRISNFSTDKIIELINKKEAIKANSANLEDYYLGKSIAAISELNPKKLEKIFHKASVELSQPHFIDKLIVPLIYKIGDMWKSGDLRISHEHFSTSIIKNFLLNIIQNSRPQENAPKIIVTTPSGQLHELGALIAASIASFEGWSVVYLGPNLPAEEIASAVSRLNCKIISLSIVYPLDDTQLDEQLKRLRLLIGDDAKILVGGRGIAGYAKSLKEINAIIINSTSELRESLNINRHI